MKITKKKALSFLEGSKLFQREALPNYPVINKSKDTLEQRYN